MRQAYSRRRTITGAVQEWCVGASTLDAPYGYYYGYGYCRKRQGYYRFAARPVNGPGSGSLALAASRHWHARGQRMWFVIAVSLHRFISLHALHCVASLHLIARIARIAGLWGYGANMQRCNDAQYGKPECPTFATVPGTGTVKTVGRR